MKLDYTSTARRLYLKYPLLSDIGIQINFWVIAYIFFFALLYFFSKAITSLYPQKAEVNIIENIIVAIIAAAIFGTILGTIDFFLEKN